MVYHQSVSSLPKEPQLPSRATGWESTGTLGASTMLIINSEENSLVLLAIPRSIFMQIGVALQKL